MKNISLLLLALLSTFAYASNETGPANTVLRVPSAGGRAQFGAVDLTQSAAVTGALPVNRGGTGVATLTSGSLVVGAGTSAVTGLAPSTAGNVPQSDGSAWSSADIFANNQQIRNCGIQASISSNTVVIDLKQADGSSAPSASAPCIVGFRSATASAGSSQTVSFTAANQIVVGATASLGHTALVGANIYLYLVQDTTKEICVSNSPYLDDGILHSATATPASTGGTLYCASSHTSRPTRLFGVVKATYGATNWSAITKVAMVPFRRYDEDVMYATYNWQGSHTYAASETMRFDTLEQDNLNAYSTSTFTYTVQIPSHCEARVGTEFGALDGTTDANITVTLCGTSRQCYNARNASNSATTAAGLCSMARGCSVGDTIVAGVTGDAGYTLDSNGNRTKLEVKCTPIPQ